MLRFKYIGSKPRVNLGPGLVVEQGDTVYECTEDQWRALHPATRETMLELLDDTTAEIIEELSAAAEPDTPEPPEIDPDDPPETADKEPTYPVELLEFARDNGFEDAYTRGHLEPVEAGHLCRKAGFAAPRRYEQRIEKLVAHVRNLPQNTGDADGEGAEAFGETGQPTEPFARRLDADL